MSEQHSAGSKRTNSGRAGSQPGSAGRKSATNIKNDISRPGSRDLLSREEEYKKLNAELEAKTANLVREAEDVLKGQDSVLSKSRLLDNINTEDFLKEFDEDLTGPNEDKTPSPEPARSLAGSARPLSSAKVANQSRPQSKTKRPSSTKAKIKSGRSNVDDVAVPDDTFLTEYKDFSLQNAISNIENQIGDLEDDIQDDVMPQAAQDMGSEAQIRFLKAKLRVMQEEMDRLAEECNKKDEANSSLSSRIKELEEERGRLHRTNAAQTTQIDRLKKLSDDAKGKSDSLQNQLTNVKKELDQMKRNQKQQLTTQNATDVRLNRALEEIERYKEQMSRTKSSSKESSDQDKRKMEHLMSENKRLEKQKNELMSGFKKQLKLIDILKRQKMHIEAAKMLQFSEEEFVKALEWGS